MTRPTFWHLPHLLHTMKPVLGAAFAVILFFGLGPAARADAFQQNQRLGRGVNIIGWDKLWQDRARGNFKDEHFKLIHQAGFSHVRINLHPLRDGRPDVQGKLRPEFFTTLDWAIDQAAANQSACDSRLSRRPGDFTGSRRHEEAVPCELGCHRRALPGASARRYCSRFLMSRRPSSRMIPGAIIGTKPWASSENPIQAAP